MVKNLMVINLLYLYVQMSQEKEKAVAIGKQTERSTKDLEKVIFDLMASYTRCANGYKTSTRNTKLFSPLRREG